MSGDRRCSACGSSIEVTNVDGNLLALRELRTVIAATLGVMADAPGPEAAAARGVLRAAARHLEQVLELKAATMAAPPGPQKGIT